LLFIAVFHVEMVSAQNFETQCFIPKNELMGIIAQLEDVLHNMRRLDFKNGNMRGNYILHNIV